jgi:restriction system protein
MTIPDYQSVMLPLLTFASDGRPHTFREAVEHLAGEFGLSPQERSELLPSGGQALFTNRVGWASFYLKKAGLLEKRPHRGAFAITARGQEVVALRPERIDTDFLERFPEFIEFRNQSRKPKDNGHVPAIGAAAQPADTPEEALEGSYQTIRQGLAQELLARVQACSPQFFERLVVELLVKMGYGGSRRDAGERIGQSGDGGIDGIIKEDRLGLDVIYIQAKRWQGSVGRPEIQKFVGALQGQRARKGVFITTSAFTADAADYASRIDTKVVLLDGNTIANLMIDFDVGVSVAASYIVKRIDSDYFEEE